MKTQKCNVCGLELPLEAFNWRWKARGEKQRTCRDCQHVQQKRWYQANRERHIANMLGNRAENIAACRRYIWDYLAEHPCVDCGETDPVVLEFDHVRGAKKSEVSTLVKQGYSLEKVKAEIEKCEVRCRNCHFRRHHRDGGWYDGS